jgi:hypothetical protein
MLTDEAARQTITELGKRYLWWKSVGDQPHSTERIIAQIMNLGTWDDILQLEETLSPSRLVEIMLQAQPGCFSERSWEFWRGRLSHTTGAAIPDQPPQRSFDAAGFAEMRSGPVKVFCDRIDVGDADDPLPTGDGTLLVASLDDLMATKLKATLDRAEAKDYRDIAAMIAAGVSLPAGLSAFRTMFKGEPAQVLRALGFFRDGDLNTLSRADREVLRTARDRVRQLPDVVVRPGPLTG